MHKLTCVLIGELGSGKTSLFNKICGTNEKADQSLHSNTLKITESRSLEGYGFNLIDTPGIGAQSKAFDHSIQILAALTDGLVNQILLVIKYQKRINILRQKIEDSIVVVKKYYSITTIIITHCDELMINLAQKKKDKQQIRQMIGDKYKIYSVVFTSIDTPTSKLCAHIDKVILCQQNGYQLSISNSLFEKLLQDQDFDQRLLDRKELFLQKYDEFYQTVLSFLQSNFATKSELQDQILNDLKQFIIQKSQQFQLKFEQKNGQLVNQVYISQNQKEEAYLYYFCIKGQMNSFNQELTKIIYSKMKYSDNHPLRKIRKCPYCQIIWYKESGCELMICGNISQQKYNNNQKDEIYNQQPQRFEFQYIKRPIKQIHLKEINQNKIKQIQNCNTKQPIKIQQVSLNEEQQTNAHLLDDHIKIQVAKNGYVGCGNAFYWVSAPLVNLEDIDIDEEQLFILLSSKQNFEFQNYKQDKIQKAKEDKKIII